MMKDTPKIMALDYGRKRIGVAVSFGTLAEPLDIVLNNLQTINNLQQVVNKHHIQKILVGISEREMAQESQEFGTKIANILDLPVTFYDETLSSVQVKKKLHQKNKGKRQYKGDIDHYAAAIFLQNYLDEEYS